MDLHVLGPVEATVDDQPVAIGAGKPRALLAMLALNEGNAVSSEALIDGLWGEAPPATAPKMVQIYVSQLRKAFRGSGNGAEIVTRGHGYELRLGAGEVDARRFERLVAEGAPREALALWRGPPLDDVATEPFAGLEIRRLEELRLTAIEQALEQDLAAGRHAEAIPEIQALLAHEPLREHLHGAAHARPLPQRPPGRRARRLPPGARRARERDRRRARPGAAPPARGDPAAGPVARPAACPPSCRRSSRPARRSWAARPSSTRCASTGAAPRPATAPSCWSTGAPRDRQDPPRRRARRRGARATAATSSTRPAPARRRRRAASSSGPGRRGARPCWCSTTTRAAEVRRARARRRRRPPAARARHRGRTATSAAMTLGPLAARRGRDDRARVRRRSAGSTRLLEESGGRAPARARAARRWARDDATAGSARPPTAPRASARGCGRPRTISPPSVVELQAARERVEPRPRDAVVACPFKGLASFDVDDADVFFGRERLVAEMVARLAGAPLLGIVGPSGQRQVVGAEGGPAARAGSRRAPRQRRLGDRAAAPRAPTRSPLSSRRSRRRRPTAGS